MNEETPKSCWWKLENDWICVYTENLKVAKKLDLKLMAAYLTKENLKKHFAYQFKVENNSREHKKLVKVLNLKAKDEYKVKGRKTEVADGKNIAKKK